MGSAWQVVKTARTDSAGRFSARLLPGRNGDWRARIGVAPVDAHGPDRRPTTDVRSEAGTAFLGAPILVRARPQTRVAGDG